MFFATKLYCSLFCTESPDVGFTCELAKTIHSLQEFPSLDLRTLGNMVEKRKPQNYQEAAASFPHQKIVTDWWLGLMIWTNGEVLWSSQSQKRKEMQRTPLKKRWLADLIQTHKQWLRYCRRRPFLRGQI